MGYSRVSYVRNNYTWFDTNVTPTHDCKIEIDFEIATQQARKNNCVMGTWFSGYSHTTTIGFVANNTRNNFSYYVGGKYNDYAGQFTIGHRYRNSLSNTQFIVNDLTTETGVTTNISGANLVASNYSIFIGTLNIVNSQSTDTHPSDIKINESWIYDGETLVGHYLPYVDNETGYGVLYDTVSDTYIYGEIASAVTAGEVLFGPDVDELDFEITGGSSTVNLISDSPWTATVSDYWITMSQTSGETGGTITVSTSSNSFFGREGSIEFTDGDNSSTLTVIQEGNTIEPIRKIWKNGRRIN